MLKSYHHHANRLKDQKIISKEIKELKKKKTCILAQVNLDFSNEDAGWWEEHSDGSRGPRGPPAPPLQANTYKLLVSSWRLRVDREDAAGHFRFGFPLFDRVWLHTQTVPTNVHKSEEQLRSFCCHLLILLDVKKIFKKKQPCFS